MVLGPLLLCYFRFCIQRYLWHISNNLTYLKVIKEMMLTNNLLSTVFTTISSGAYWLTSNLSLRHLSSPSCWINGELISSYHVFASFPALCDRSELVFDVDDCVVVLQ